MHGHMNVKFRIQLTNGAEAQAEMRLRTSHAHSVRSIYTSCICKPGVTVNQTQCDAGGDVKQQTTPHAATVRRFERPAQASQVGCKARDTLPSRHVSSFHVSSPHEI